MARSSSGGVELLLLLALALTLMLDAVVTGLIVVVLHSDGEGAKAINGGARSSRTPTNSLMKQLERNNILLRMFGGVSCYCCEYRRI
jgi:hypothetical protein